MQIHLKIIFQIFLIIGINICFFSCGEDNVELIGKVDFIYSNQTNSFVKLDLITSDIEIVPSGVDTLEVEVDGWSANTNLEICCEGLMQNLFELGGKNRIVINDTLCVLHENRTFLISNYEAVEVESRYYTYTYTFTSEDFIDAELCE